MSHSLRSRGFTSTVKNGQFPALSGGAPTVGFSGKLLWLTGARVEPWRRKLLVSSNESSSDASAVADVVRLAIRHSCGDSLLPKEKTR